VCGLVPQARCRHVPDENGCGTHGDDIWRAHASGHVAHASGGHHADEHGGATGRQNWPAYVWDNASHHGTNMHIRSSCSRRHMVFKIWLIEFLLAGYLSALSVIRDCWCFRGGRCGILRCDRRTRITRGGTSPRIVQIFEFVLKLSQIPMLKMGAFVMLANSRKK
jgi:hypothetical protein